ncbi:MAG: TonB-dependent receptor, partial [Sphingobacteriales bacterium]
MFFRRGLLPACLCLSLSDSRGQDITADSIYTAALDSVVVQGYSPGRSWSRTPASVGQLNQAAFQRYNNTSLAPALNTIAGVRMEERSPGSYRLSIRGSSLRSPFGVRNVKIYYNSLPVSDPGGFTYLNMFGFENISSATVIKGPGSSMYGAGNGGVLLLQSLEPDAAPMVSAAFTAGSYNLRTASALVQIADSYARHAIRMQHAAAGGYRDQSATERNTFSWDARIKKGPSTTLAAHLLYNRLYYQTPGGLNSTELENNPRAARPGASASQAAIHQQNALAGMSVRQELAKDLINHTALYVLFSEVNNPNTRNYSRTTDPHFGGRTVFQYTNSRTASELQLHAGMEVQKGLAYVRTYTNKLGNPDSLMSDEEIRTHQLLFFGQGTLQLHRWVIEAGGSISNMDLDYIRHPQATVEKRLQAISPRVAVLYRLPRYGSVYLNVARGFSPPTSQE